MTKVKEGDTIRISYKGKLEDGTVFDFREMNDPLEFTVGEGEVVEGLETGVIGMVPGETKSIRIPAEKGYGLRTEERVFELDKKRVPEGVDPEIGGQLQMFRADGLPVMVTVIAKSDNSFTMDCNHPLAGKTLIFDTTLVEIV